MPNKRILISNSCPLTSVTDKLEEYRQKVAGTNIDQKSLLSTDYFNTFNSVVMVLDMLPDMPDLMEEIEQWQFLDYPAHFRASGLDFAELAIEAYQYSPPELRLALEEKIGIMKVMVEECGRALRVQLDAGQMEVFASTAHSTAEQLRSMMEEGNALVHGESKSTQTDIDTMFDSPAQTDIDAMFNSTPAQTADIDAMFENKSAQTDIDAMFDSKPAQVDTSAPSEKKPTQADIDAMFS